MAEWFSIRRLSASVRRSSAPRKAEKSSESHIRPLPSAQEVLLLRGPRQDYELVRDYPVHSIGVDEVLVETRAIGLNPIDWKAP